MVLLSNLFEAPGTVVLTVFAEQEYDSAAALGLMLGVLEDALAGALAYSAGRSSASPATHLSGASPSCRSAISRSLPCPRCRSLSSRWR